MWHCPHATAAVNQWDRQMDGQTLDSFKNPAPHTRAFQFAIRIDSIHYANRFESIHFVKNRPFGSLVVLQFFCLFIV